MITFSEHFIDLPSSFPAQVCPECGEVRRRYVACLEAVLSGNDNYLRGIEGRVRFADCWHVVPHWYVPATAVATYIERRDHPEEY